MKLWLKIEEFINMMCEWLGRFSWLLVLYSMAFGLYDVIMRYFFNKPSLWIGVTIQYAMVLLACFAGAYALNKDAFVKLDLFYGKASPKTKAIFDIITYSFTLLYLYILVTKGLDAGLAAWKIKQVTPTAIPIPLYHLKMCIPLGAFLVLVVATKKLVGDVMTLFGVDMEHHRVKGLFDQGSDA